MLYGSGGDSNGNSNSDRDVRDVRDGEVGCNT